MDNRNKIPAPRPLRNTGKNLDQFCHYHNSPGHWTSACFVLRDAVEQLVREGALQEFVDQTRGQRTPEQALQQVPNRAQPVRRPNNDQRRVVEPNIVQPQRPQEGEDLLGVIFAIFGGDKPGHTPSQRRAYCKEAYRDPVGMQVNMTEASRAHPRNSPVPITFTEDEGKRLHHPHWDALVINLEI